MKQGRHNPDWDMFAPSDQLSGGCALCSVNLFYRYFPLSHNMSACVLTADQNSMKWQYWMQNYMERIETNYLQPDWLEIILTILGFIHTDWVGSFCLDKDRFLQTDWFLQWQFITDWCQVVWTRGGFLLKYWFDHVYGPISWIDSSKCLSPIRRIKAPKLSPMKD